MLQEIGEGMESTSSVSGNTEETRLAVSLQLLKLGCIWVHDTLSFRVLEIFLNKIFKLRKKD